MSSVLSKLKLIKRLKHPKNCELLGTLTLWIFHFDYARTMVLCLLTSIILKEKQSQIYMFIMENSQLLKNSGTPFSKSGPPNK